MENPTEFDSSEGIAVRPINHVIKVHIPSLPVQEHSYPVGVLPQLQRLCLGSENPDLPFLVCHHPETVLDFLQTTPLFTVSEQTPSAIWFQVHLCSHIYFCLPVMAPCGKATPAQNTEGVLLLLLCGAIIVLRNIFY